jgi:adenylate cyclase
LATGRVERRLAAILAADVAGYSRLMGADEEGTLAALKAIRRELADPKVSLWVWLGARDCRAQRHRLDRRQR